MNVNEFKNHLEATGDAIMDNGYKSEYDVTITVNGKTITLELHADLLESLTAICDNE